MLLCSSKNITNCVPKYFKCFQSLAYHIRCGYGCYETLSPGLRPHANNILYVCCTDVYEKIGENDAFVHVQ